MLFDKLHRNWASLAGWTREANRTHVTLGANRTHRAYGYLSSLLFIILFIPTPLFTACERKPELHLYEGENVVIDLPIVDLDLQVYWDYEMDFNVQYDWKAEWYYGWDETDVNIFGEIGYVLPSVFNLRRYYTGDEPLQPHQSVLAATVEGTHFQGSYDWGFWDILCWNEVSTIDGVQSLVFDEQTSLDSVTAATNQTMHVARYQAPRYTHAFYSPEPLFSAYDQGIEINSDLEGFEYDAERNVYVKKLNMLLLPVTYIYLTQVVLHHNNGRIALAHGEAVLSGFARSTNVNTGRAGDDAITVYYSVRKKDNLPYVPYNVDPATVPDAERVDVIGGRLMTFGICGMQANKIKSYSQVNDPNRHYMDLTVQFNNGMDSTFVFDVTEQVRQRYKGGVITVELDMDTVPIPRRSGGSGFDAVVKDFEDGGTHEFEM